MSAQKYSRIRIVGTGSFGCCWLVRNEAGEQCILKMIDVSRMPHKQKQEAANEVTVLAKLRHPYIINYRESYVEDGMLCIITDYAEKGDVYGAIQQQKRAGRLFPERLILRWFTQICLALKHMHDRRILHRDLKTQNIFLSGSGEGSVKIGDFGIARVLHHTQDCARTAIGTPYYLSPEICQEKPYNHKSDIWSLGCILYELTSLQHAFDADSMKGLVLKILRGVPPKVPTAFSPEVRSLVPELLTKDPSLRPSIESVLQRPVVRAVIFQLLHEVEKSREGALAHAKRSPEERGSTAGTSGARKSSEDRSESASAKRKPEEKGRPQAAPQAAFSGRREPQQQPAARAERPQSGMPSNRPGSSPGGVSSGGRQSHSVQAMSSPTAAPAEAIAVPKLRQASSGADHGRACGTLVSKSERPRESSRTREEKRLVQAEQVRPPDIADVPSPCGRLAAARCTGHAGARSGPGQQLSANAVASDHKSRLRDIREQYQLEKARWAQPQSPKNQQPPPLSPQSPQSSLECSPWTPQSLASPQLPERTLDIRAAVARTGRVEEAREESQQQKRCAQEDERQNLRSFMERQQRQAHGAMEAAPRDGRSTSPQAAPKSGSGGDSSSGGAQVAVVDCPSRPTELAPGAVEGEAKQENQHLQLISTLQEGLNLQSLMCADNEQDVESPGDDSKESAAVVATVSPEECGVPRFLRPDGQVVALRVSDKDSLTYRIEALREYLERELGLRDFKCTYEYLNSKSRSDAQLGAEQPELDEKPLESLVQTKAIRFLALVHQLIVCEDRCFSH